jgi:hypothetical protein
MIEENRLDIADQLMEAWLKQPIARDASASFTKTRIETQAIL